MIEREREREREREIYIVCEREIMTETLFHFKINAFLFLS